MESETKPVSTNNTSNLNKGNTSTQIVNTSFTTANLNTSTTEQRSTSISSDEFSDLTELDSETETVKMYTNCFSQLQKLADSHKQVTDIPTKEELSDQDHMQAQDDLIKEEINSQIEEELKNNTQDEDVLSLDSSEKLGQVIEEEIKKASEESTLPPLPQGKRKLNDFSDVQNKDLNNNTEHYNLEESTKRPKLQSTEIADSSQEALTIPVERDESNVQEPRPDQENPLQNHKNDNQENLDTETIEKIEIVPEIPGEINTEKAEDDAEAEGDHEESDVQDEEDQIIGEPKPTENTSDSKIEAPVSERSADRDKAVDFLTEIEVDFAKLRDRLYEDRMARFKTELEMCLNGSHPDLQSVYSRIDAYREDKIKLAKLNHRYRLEGIERKTMATRTSIHQQFIRSKTDFKMKYLKDKTEEWYRINKERRTLDDVVPEFGYRRPVYTEDAVHQRLQVNKEIQTLGGLNIYYGFPTAPHFQPLVREELDDDLRAMNIL